MKFLRYSRPQARTRPLQVDFAYVAGTSRPLRQRRKSRRGEARRSYRHLLGVFKNGRRLFNVVNVTTLEQEQGERVLVTDCQEYRRIRHWLVEKFPTAYSVLDGDLLDWSSTWMPCQEIIDLIAAVLKTCRAFFVDNSYHGDLEDTDNFLVRQLPPRPGQTHGEIEVKIVPVGVCERKNKIGGRTVIQVQEADFKAIAGLIDEFILPPDLTNDNCYPAEMLDFKRRLRGDSSMTWRANLLALGSLQHHPVLWTCQRRKDFVVRLMVESDNCNRLADPTQFHWHPTLIENIVCSIREPFGNEPFGNDGVTDWQVALTDVNLAPAEFVAVFADKRKKGYDRHMAGFLRFIYNLVKHIGDWLTENEFGDKRSVRKYISDEVWLNPKYMEHQLNLTFPTYLIDVYNVLVEHGYAFEYWFDVQKEGRRTLWGAAVGLQALGILTVDFV